MGQSDEERAIVYAIQRKIAAVGALGSGVIALVNYVKYSIVAGQLSLHTLALPHVSLTALIGAVVALTGLRDLAVLRVIHVAFFLILGFAFSIVRPIGELTGVLFFSYGIILMVQYRLARRHICIWIALLLGAHAVGIGVSGALREEGGPLFGVPTAVIAVMFFLFFWTAFAEEIRRYASEAYLLREQRDRNKVFVRFGKNLSGMIHNLKSSLNAVNGYVGLLADDTAEEREEVATMAKRAAGHLESTINDLLFAVRAYQRTDYEAISLNACVRSMVEVLRSTPIFRSKIQIDLCLSEPDTVWASPIALMQVLDNLMTNAGEAMVDTDDRFVIQISTEFDAGVVRLAIEDQGPGIVFCGRCSDPNGCIDCREFAMGRSTKPNGSGIGMVFVQHVLREMGGTLRLRPGDGRGTRAIVELPLADALGDRG